MDYPDKPDNDGLLDCFVTSILAMTWWGGQACLAITLAEPRA